MPTVSDLQALDLIQRLPDDVLLTTAEAAVFLRCSVRTLERLRQPGEDGPDYVQPGGAGAMGRNQKCLYRKSDLKAWIQRMIVKDSTAAAVRKGQLFRTLADLAEERPYWRNEAGLIAGSVWETSVDVFFARLLSPLWQVEWLPASDACMLPWTGFIAKRAHAGSVERVLSDVLGGIRGALERDEMESAALEGAEPVRERI